MIVERKKRRGGSFLESDFQTAVNRRLKHWSNAGVLIYKRAPRGFGPGTTGKLKSSGVIMPGEPDNTIFLRGGKTIFIELKRNRERPSGVQKDVHSRLFCLGFEVYTLNPETPRHVETMIDEIVRGAYAGIT